MEKESKKAILESKIAGLDHEIFSREVDLEALKAESKLGTEEENYEARVKQYELGTEKLKARSKSYSDQLKAL